MDELCKECNEMRDKFQDFYVRTEVYWSFDENVWKITCEALGICQYCKARITQQLNTTNEHNQSTFVGQETDS